MIGSLFVVSVGIAIVVVFFRMTKTLQVAYDACYVKVKAINHELETIKALSYLLQNQTNLKTDIKQLIYTIVSHGQYTSCTLIVCHQDNPSLNIFRYISSVQNSIQQSLDFNVTEDSQLTSGEKTIVDHMTDKKEAVSIDKSDFMTTNAICIPLNINNQNSGYLICYLSEASLLIECQKHSLGIIGNITAHLLHRYSLFEQIPIDEQMKAVQSVW